MTSRHAIAAVIAGGSLVAAACAPRPVPVTTPHPTSPQAESREEPAEVVRVEQAGVTCSQALRASRDALRSLGFGIEEVVPARAGRGGRVVALRREGWTAASPQPGPEHRVIAAVDCDDSGATVVVSGQASGLGRLRFPGQFRAALRDALAQAPPRAAPAAPGRVDRRREPERGVVVEVRPLRLDEAAPAVAEALAGAGLLPVWVVIRNGTDRSYAFAPSDVRLVTVEGRRREPIAEAELQRRLGAERAARLGAAAIAAGVLAPAARSEGYVYVEAATYARASLRLTEVESGEAEGFSIRF